MRVTINIDGGARGNPGPAGAGYIIRSDDGRTVLRGGGIWLGTATNNQAEYRGLLAGLKAAVELGADEVDVLSDSELLVRQLNGQYRVRNEGLLPLYHEALTLRQGFKGVTFRHVRREQNTDADRLANMAMDQRRDVID